MIDDAACHDSHRFETADPAFDPEADRLREECGVFGIFGHPEAAAITALGLHALQHRGQEAAGIVAFDGHRFNSERRLGLVSDHFSKASTIARLPGTAAVGHVRYSTTGETILRNVQPLFAELDTGGIAVAHNGNLTNGLTLRRELIRDGAIYQSTSDTEVILHLVARSRKPRVIERFIEALRELEGAYALVTLSNKALIGAATRSASARSSWASSTGTTCWPPRPARSTSSALASSAMSRTARSSSSPRPVSRACGRSRASRRGPASSSTSISPGPTRSCTGVPSMACAKRWAPSWRARPGKIQDAMPTSSSPFPTAACRRPSATRRPPASRSSSASSATITSGAPSSSRRNRTARAACA